MKFSEAAKLFEEGKQVRCSKWKPNIYIHKDASFPSSWGISVQDMLEEWEVYEESQKTYSFMEMIPLLVEGKKFARQFWPSAVYLGWTWDNGAKIFSGKIKWGCLNLECYQATDWIQIKGDPHAG